MREAPGDADLRARFQAWLAASPAHPLEWEEVKRTWGAIGRTDPVFADKWRDVAPRRPVWRLSWSLGLAASLAAFCFLALAVPDLALKLQADQQTGPAERRSVRLEDGSVVRLGPRSAIDIDFQGQQRRIRLLKGEAFFEVAHDAARPFTVQANGLEATDIGTAFDVRTGPAGARVAVREGVVDVRSRQLTAGDWVSLSAGGRMQQGHGPPEEIAPWIQGRLVAKNRTVAEIVEEIRPYFDGLILLRGDTLAQTPLTGVYTLDDPAAALLAVAQSEGAKLYRISPWVIVLSGA